ncbi:MipA/OmpV family protein [Salipiger bermudensis]|uniref:MipA/OmpV family protein n=1 Tax=Salipiger bermudensis TaxID=344736 RepID=UPI001CD67089|nr:MipA/OmpV family protein [Salipiger bermudensis]MCA0963826.1 MipA/OmpV family protein [Salipiger bermudensis]
MTRLRTATALALALLAAPAMVSAQEATSLLDTSADATASEATFSTQGTRQRGFVFSLRGGVGMEPKYLGSDEYGVTPDLGFRFHGLRLSDGLDFGDSDAWNDFRGFDVHGSFDYIGKRDASEYDDLDGMDDIDATVELGMGVGYTAENYRTYADVRRGFGGHEGWVGEAGFDFISRPTSDWRLSMGPRLYWGNDEVADTYFGVSASEATGDRPAYDADGGLLGAGAEFVARYQINRDWGLEGGVEYRSLLNDAADSPIVDDGAQDQWSVRFGVIRVVRLNF